jgi:Putative beta-barrel porin 2
VPEWAPPITAYPAELLGLLAPPAERGPFTLRPSIAISEEYNDNVLLDNHRRRWDLISRFSPALTLTANRPAYELRAGYTFSAEVYARETELNDPFKNQTFVASGLYRGTRGLTLTVADTFALNRDTNIVASQGFSTGRQETLSNTFSPGMTWQMTPQTSLNMTGTFLVQRFLSADVATSTPGVDSNTYGLLTTVDHRLTRRLTGSVGYGFTYLDFLGEQTNAIVHTPSVGATYVVTPTLTASVRGGPAITQVDDNVTIGPAVAARVLQVFQVGSVSLDYSRAVGVAGGFGGVNETQTISAGLTLPTWQRGLVIALTPTYSSAKSTGNTGNSTAGRQTSNVDVNAFTLPLAVSYQFARFASVFAEYRFFRQRTGAGSSFSTDVDQNRLRFGLQFGYPFNFD